MSSSTNSSNIQTTNSTSNNDNNVDENKSPLQFKILATDGCARACEMILPHGTCYTPMFMPVGTQGTLKGITPQQLYDLNCPLILSNTYHLGHRPGGDVVEKMGGLHKFMNWKGNLLTDSGGFQMVSLLKLAKITEHGVEFESPHNGSTMVLTPEESMKIQNQIGADIMMALDDVVKTTTDGPRVEEAMHRTLRWIDRCIKAHKRPHDQNLFGIVQGGLNEDLRRQCIAEMTKRDLPGFAIGGLSGGESKDQFWRIVHLSASLLPANKPRYLMGVGFAVDLVVCSALGVDMFDCVFPTRTARFGMALVPHGSLKLKTTKFEKDINPIDKDCYCYVCKKFTRAYLHSICHEEVGIQYITYHNVAYQMRLMQQIRDSIKEKKLGDFVRTFMSTYYSKEKYPQWVVDAMKAVNIELTPQNLPKSE